VVLGEVLCDLLPPAPGVALEEAATFTPALGGAPANVAVQLARLGLPTALITAVGEEPLSTRALRVLRAAGVDTSSVIVRRRGRLGLTLVSVDADGERAFFPWREGAADQTLRADEVDEALIARARCLVRGTVSMRSREVREATRYAVAQAHAADVPVVLDVNLRRKMFAVEAELLGLARESVRGAQIVKATREEAAALLKAPDDDDATLMAKLLDEGPDLVLLTLGEQGAKAATRKANAFAPAPAVDVVDATGAGDAFLGAAAAALFAGDGVDIEQLHASALLSLLTTANAAGAAACTALGATAGLLDRDRLPLPPLHSQDDA
jgi:sugar/nucleoside kinase (ribokinase family)